MPGHALGYSVMKASKALVLSAVSTAAGSIGGLALAHQHEQLIPHLHPHFGVEHLLLIAAVAVGAWYLLRRLRR